MFSELNFDFADKPVNKDNWNDKQKETVSEARIIASKNDYQIYYVQTNTDSLREWKGISTKIIKDNHGFAMVCSHNPGGFKWVFSSLSKEFSKSFSETRHVPIDIKSDTGVPKTFVDFLEKIRVDEDSIASSIVSKVSDAFDSFAIQIHDELTVNVFEALKILSEGIILDKSNNLTLDEQTLEDIREPSFILLYRIMFVLYAEDRSVFPDEKFYHDNFSLKWIKSQWILKSDHDVVKYQVHERLKKLFRLIEMGSEDLDYDPKKFSMRSYYGRLFDRKIHSNLEKWKIPNKNLLDAISLLTRTRDKKGNYFFLDYAALETRHLGSIYEHLLEYHLTVKDGKVSDLPNPKERKSTGSYYTPKYIVDYIVENAIGPLIDDIIKKTDDPSEQVDQILALNVLDPAMGSGHFLVGATNYIARRICQIEHKDEITELAFVERKRDVARRCIYGVDINPLAVDLASVSLWLETLSSEKPLSFLSAHIKSGNSLIGSSIDDILEKQTTLMESTKGRTRFKKTVRDFIMLETWEDDTAQAVKTKIVKYGSMQSKGTVYYDLKFLLDAKLAKSFDVDVPPIGDFVTKIGENSLDFYSDERWQQVKETASEHSFFHWDLEFPDIFYDENGKRKKNPGFDAVVGNPPWEILEPNINEFFGLLHNSDKLQKFTSLKKSEKNEIIKKLLENSEISSNWKKYNSDIDIQQEFFKNSSQYTYQIPQIAVKRNKIKSNLYQLFVEKYYHLLKKNGIAGVILPSGIYTDLGSNGLRNMLFNKNKIISLYGFENRKGIFKEIHRQFKFITLIFSKGSKTSVFKSAFYLQDADQLSRMKTESIDYDIEIVRKLSPIALSIIECSNKKDVEIFKKMSEFSALSYPEWGLEFQREFNMTDDAPIFNTEGNGAVLFEGKMIHQFTHTFKKPRYWIDFGKARNAISSREKTKVNRILSKNNKKSKSIQLQIPADHFRIGWRLISNATNQRTLICTILPPNVYLGNSLNYIRPIFFNGSKFEKFLSYKELLYLCGMLNSFVIDFLIRHKVAINVNMFYVKEITVPKLTEDDPLLLEIANRVARLICITQEYEDIKNELKINDVVTNEIERNELMAQINAYATKICNISKENLGYILDNFPIVAKEFKNQVLIEYEKI